MPGDDLGLLLRETLLLIVKLGGPPLGAALVIGLVVSLLQAVTQINEASLAFLPKMVGIGLILMLTGGFMLSQLGDFTHLLFDRVIAAGG